MKKTLLIITLLVLSLEGALASEKIDYNRFKQNVVEYFTADQFANDDEVKKYLESASEDGSWSDIDYNSKARSGWAPIFHTDRMLKLACAYRSEKSPYFKSDKIAALYLKNIDYWLKVKPKSPNWWQGRIGVPKSVVPSLILMEDVVNDDYKRRAAAILKPSSIGMTGQNRVWLSGIVFLRGVYYGNDTEVINGSREIRKEVVVSLDGEGIQADNSYHQHGPQQQFGNYGGAYVGDMAKWAKIFSGTSCAFDKGEMKILRDYILEGQKWVSWREKMDIHSLGRQWQEGAPHSRYKSIGSAIKFFIEADPDHKKEYEEYFDYTKTVGHKHFWCSDYTLKRTKDYFFTIKMCSERVLGAESCNDEHLKGYYSGDGAALLYQDGDEYDDIAPLWDWRKEPGVTLAQSNSQFKVLTWKGYHIESTFVGGASDGVNGATAMKYIRDGVEANKSWFVLNDMIFCLGSGINSALDSEITTSINQTYSRGKIATSKGEISDLKDSKDLKWVWHNKVGYLFPKEGSISLTNRDVKGSWVEIAKKYRDDIVSNKVFSLWLSHGKQPKEATYCYVMVPNASEKETKKLSGKLGYKITTKKELQIVEKEDKTIGGVVAYKATKFDLLNGMSLSQPAILLYKKTKKGVELKIADPTRKLSEVTITLEGAYKGENCKTKGGKTTINVALPKGGLAGSTKSISLEKI